MWVFLFPLHYVCGFAKKMFSILAPQIAFFFINLIDVRLWCFGHFNFAIEFVSLCRSMVAVKMHFSEIFFFQICIQYRIAALVKKERKIKTNILFMRAKKMSSIGFWCNGCFFLHWCKSSWIVVLKLVTFIFFIN